MSAVWLRRRTRKLRGGYSSFPVRGRIGQRLLEWRFPVPGQRSLDGPGVRAHAAAAAAVTGTLSTVTARTISYLTWTWRRAR